ncbi:M3 family metallopeptidase [Candidatus Aalborgicola defluviihabitans]|uniref:M3 family metallopeptidase n=1 Tax=Candidatus Aalborgicola defluviihabitans TaxID=3386187 RepID=UPI00390C2D23|nr:peptidase M3 [Burkholderiales bacterium]
MLSARALFDTLNTEYLTVHKTKEDLFWDTYMAVSNDDAGFTRAEEAYKNFISDPKRLAAVRQALASLPDTHSDAGIAELRHGLQGWLALFEANIIDSDEARAAMHQLIQMESALFAKRRDLVLHHINEAGEEEEASLSGLSTNMGTNPNMAARKSSLDAMLTLEHWVLANGFLDIVKQRNAFARAQGFANYFDFKVQKNERMSTGQLFAILDDFEARTAQANTRALNDLVHTHGADATQPWNLRFYVSGDTTRQLDPYLSFGKGLERWITSFRHLGIAYRGATLQLDLLERKGKYQNGFCHGPIPPFFDAQQRWVPGQINFTANAKPDQVGSGARAINTLFHEGGHAAHFANVTQNAPCFSQEFAPTSMAYAETQSMFCDSLLDDADWLKRYAHNAQGEPIPDALIHARIQTTQPFAAFNERGILVVPYFERALYQLTDEQLTPDGVLALARATELRILGVATGPRPLLSIPHLLNQESAAAYHGYLLANMAVYQTRAYFERTYGYLTDNPAIGPALAEHYWARGNGISHNDTLLSLTGESFSAKYLADSCNQTVGEAWAQAQAQMAAAAQRQYPPAPIANLDATIRIVHGAELIADNRTSEDAMCQQFEGWVEQHFPATVH